MTSITLEMFILYENVLATLLKQKSNWKTISFVGSHEHVSAPIIGILKNNDLLPNCQNFLRHFREISLTWSLLISLLKPYRKHTTELTATDIISELPRKVILVKL